MFFVVLVPFVTDSTILILSLSVSILLKSFFFFDILFSNSDNNGEKFYWEIFDLSANDCDLTKIYALDISTWNKRSNRDNNGINVHLEAFRDVKQQ